MVNFCCARYSRNTAIGHIHMIRLKRICSKRGSAKFSPLNPIRSNNFYGLTVSMVLFGCVVPRHYCTVYIRWLTVKLIANSSSATFASSLSPVYLAHTMGYFDVIDAYLLLFS